MNNTAFYVEKSEKALEMLVPSLTGELSQVEEMLRYSLTGGGKRIRPLLCLEFCNAAGGNGSLSTILIVAGVVLLGAGGAAFAMKKKKK